MSTSEPLKIGFLFSSSGVTGLQESSQLRGAMQALDEVNDSGGIDGREVIAVRYDPQSQDALFRSFAERLILADKVNVIFGGYRSSARKIMLPVVEKYNRLLFYPQLYEGFEFSEHIIYGGAAPNQNGVQLAEFMAGNFGARVYMIGSRYVYPYECNRNMQELILQNENGAVIGERYLGLDAPYEEFVQVIDDVIKKQPDFIFSSAIGQTISYLYQAYARAGLDPMKIPIGSLNTSETELAAMGVEFGAGHYTSAPYFQAVNSAENQRALEGFRKRYGSDISADMNWEASYYQFHLFANACAAAGSDSIAPLKFELLGSEYAAPQGRVKIDRKNQHTGLYPRIGRADAAGQFTVLRESREMVAPDPYMSTQSFGDWVTKLTTAGYADGG
ncbi:transporter substrate-binding domain-containing protein [Pollutimonas bauzanensis]|uniref:Amino acid/amide ABC transporter substrate-binding protein, HAAT family (TC 3.A.1.4.-) n=1 Tax=Pollutimonas bauzanensis TaxID=658167 RepID=A0A1M5UR63_9BURK|nr:transporter substrate-binding domain-containing protein [Pollutimonas bauzanensis]SHH65414.1 amino acid/amide ABC transporter substrate-binding protein, HAAT family (TC 3.A.1.4.-) [Pollutimonas bauzanensis]